MIYQLKPGILMPAFLHAVDSCPDEVIFETPEGDKLNLKSQLSKYLFLTVALDARYLETSVIRCTAEAAEHLSEFLLIP